MFSSFMTDTWIVASIVALVAGVVGFFVVLRGSAFVADALPTGAFLGALGIGLLGRRGRHDVAVALALVVMLGVGALFLSFSVEYAPEIESLLFGEVLGISVNEIAPVAALGGVCIVAILVMYRPLLLSSVMPELGEARGVRAYRIEMLFLVVVALATSMALPVVGALLIFSLMIGPPAAARSVTSRPMLAIGLSAAIAVATVWTAIASSYVTNWPVGFFVGTIGAACYAIGRGWAAVRRIRIARSVRLADASGVLA
jgi:zinc/manganese transport system permease protein